MIDEAFSDVLRYVCISVQIAVLACVLLQAFRIIRRGNRTMSAVFFTFATATFLVSDLYWLAFILLKQDARLPFMPSDVADNGVLLLLGSMVTSAFRGREGKTAGVTAAAIAFALANVGLWIAWSGEWVKDLVGAAPYAFLLCAVARGLKLSGALNRGEWTALGIGCAALIALEIAMFFCAPAVNTVLDAVCSGLLLAGSAMFTIRTVRAMNADVPAEIGLCLAAATETWCLCFMYMSAEPMWFAADLLCTVAFAMMVLAVERQVAEA